MTGNMPTLPDYPLSVNACVSVDVKECTAWCSLFTPDHLNCLLFYSRHSTVTVAGDLQ